MRTLIILSFLISNFAFGAVASRVYTFTDGSILTASQLNNEFNNLIDTVNSLDNANITTSANILPIKINATIAGSAVSRNGSTGALSVVPDNVGIEISSNALQLKDAGVTNAKLATNSVSSAKIANDAVTNAKILDGAISQDKYADNSILAAKLTTNSVTESKILNGAVTHDKLGAASVTFDKLYARATSSSASVGNVMLSPSSGTNIFTVEETLVSASLNVSTSARPIFIGLINDDPSLEGYFNMSYAGSTIIKFKINGTAVATYSAVVGENNSGAGGGQLPCSSYFTIVTTTTTGAKAITATGSATNGAQINNCKLVAYEL